MQRITSGERWRADSRRASSGREPDGAHDAAVQRAPGIVTAHLAGERKPQVGDALGGGAVLIHADESGRRERVCAFFQRLARHCVDQRFPGLEMAGGLVEKAAAGGFLLDQQETAVAFNHRRDRDVGLPDHGAYFSAGPRLMPRSQKPAAWPDRRASAPSGRHRLGDAAHQPLVAGQGQELDVVVGGGDPLEQPRRLLVSPALQPASPSRARTLASSSGAAS